MRHHYQPIGSVCHFWEPCGSFCFLEVMMKRKRSDWGTMRCPYCGSPVILRSADGIYKDNPRGMRLYVCSRYPACNAYVQVHPGTRIPMGSLANPKLRRLRQQAHRAFDRIYLTGIMTKDQAYAWLADLIQGPRSQAHIGYLSEYYCGLVIAESQKILARHRKAPIQGNSVSGREG